MPIESEIAPAITELASPPGLTRDRKWRWKSWLRAAIVVCVVAALGLSVERSIAHWKSQSLESRLHLTDLDFIWMLVAAGLYALGLIPGVMVLARALSSLGIHASLRNVMAAQLVGHLGKYVPGKAMVIVLRTAMLNRGGSNVSIRAATIAIMIETLTAISTGAMLSLLVLQFLETPVWKIPVWIKQASVWMAVGAFVATWPPFLRRVLSHRMIGGTLPFNWTVRDMFAACLWNSVGWMLIGGSVTAVLYSLPETVRNTAVSSPVELYLICFVSIALAFVAGFLSLLPGGAGVRELVITTMLTPIAGPSGAIVVAIITRMIQLLVEMTLGGTAWITTPTTGFSATDVDETQPSS